MAVLSCHQIFFNLPDTGNLVKHTTHQTQNDHGTMHSNQTDVPGRQRRKCNNLKKIQKDFLIQSYVILLKPKLSKTSFVFVASSPVRQISPLPFCAISVSIHTLVYSCCHHTVCLLSRPLDLCTALIDDATVDC